jgi:hypothetical protein
MASIGGVAWARRLDAVKLMALVALSGGCSDGFVPTSPPGLTPAEDSAVEATEMAEPLVADQPTFDEPAPGPLYWMDQSYAFHASSARIALISQAERVAAAYVASLVGNDCNPAPGVDIYAHPRGPFLSCRLTEALGLGVQCGEQHFRFMKQALGPDLPPWCVSMPTTAYFQTALTELSVSSSGRTTTVDYDASGTTGPDGKAWQWHETITFEQQPSGSLRLLKRARTGDPPGGTEAPL